MIATVVDLGIILQSRCSSALHVRMWMAGAYGIQWMEEGRTWFDTACCACASFIFLPLGVQPRWWMRGGSDLIVFHFPDPTHYGNSRSILSRSRRGRGEVEVSIAYRLNTSS